MFSINAAIEKVVNKNPVANNGRYSGICSMCAKASTCIYRKNSKRAVLQCDEFVGSDFLGEIMEDKTETRLDDPIIRTNPKKFFKMPLWV